MQDQYNLPLDSIILGFTGPIGSGCSYIARGFSEISNGKYKYISLSDIIRRSLKEEGIDNPSIEQLQNRGNELRRNQTAHLVFELLEEELRDFKGDGLIIDSIKNEGEVLALRRWPNFYLFSVHADTEVRKKRCLQDQRFESGSDFDIADIRDQIEQYEYGQQVKRCDYLSDIVIYNNSQIPTHAHIEREKYLRSLYHSYVDLIEKSIDIDMEQGIKEKRSPNKHELCMTIAYSFSKMSSCLKRKVGAIIVEDEEARINEKDAVAAPGARVESIPFIVSSGFNEVPLGSYKCIFDPRYEKCHRDFLQEEHAIGYKHCPSCGRPINLKFVCSCGQEYTEFVKSCRSCLKEMDCDYRCECGVTVFQRFLPGGKQSPGKLLDVCRAVHAEEMALLRLSKTGRASSDNLVLYTSTQPCNLCANKIVTAGIRTVVFAEPYSMKQADEILENGGVSRKRFQGVKSSAYFRLYR